MDNSEDDWSLELELKQNDSHLTQKNVETTITKRKEKANRDITIQDNISYQSN